MKDNKKKITKKAKEDLLNDSWMFILLLSTMTILGYAISPYKFDINNTSLSYSIFAIPVLFFISNYITKKYGYQKTVAAIAISSVSMVLFLVIMNFAMSKPTILLEISGEFCAIVISQFVNLTIFYFLQENTTHPMLLIFLTFVFSIVVFYLFYTLINMEIMLTDEYWNGYFTSIAIQSIECLILAIIDHYIKKERA